MPDFSDLDFGETLRGMREGQTVFNSRYTLVRQIGRCGMGAVLFARDEELERDVALKFLPEVIAKDAAAIRDLKRETRRALELTHPRAGAWGEKPSSHSGGKCPAITSAFARKRL